MPDVPERLRPWAWFLAWGAAGGTYAAGIVGAASIGVVCFPVAIVATVVLLGRRATLVGLPGVGLGAAGALGYVAYTDRHGPGTFCQESATGNSFHCIMRSSPWPWLAGGVLVLALTLAVFVVLQRRRAAGGRSALG